MNFSSVLVPINSNKLHGLFQLNLVKKISLLFIELIIYEIKFNSNELIPTIMKSVIDSCNSNPNNKLIFNSVDTEIIYKKEFNYEGIEKLNKSFIKIINTATREGKQIISFNSNVELELKYLRRLQRFTGSVINNYNILNDIISYVIKIPEIKNETPNELIIKKNEEKKENLIIKNDEFKDSNIQKILEFLLITPQFLGYLIHLILNYYQFYDDAKIEENKFISGNIFPAILSYNKSYLLILIKSLEKVKLDKINLVLKNILDFTQLKKAEFKSIHIKCILFILFIYCVRHMTESGDDWLINKLDIMIYDPEVQTKILNKYCKLISKNHFEFEINKNNIEFDNTLFNTKEISEKYNYLKIIDQEDFINTVYDKTKIKKQSSIPIGFYTLLDITKKINSDNITNSLLNYRNKKILTEIFDYFLKYIDNPISIKIISQNFKFINIVKYFDILKTILNDINLPKNKINTYYYYQLIKNNTSEDIPYMAIMIIIYQIIIPYMYYYYGVTEFEDVFLYTYKLNN